MLWQRTGLAPVYWASRLGMLAMSGTHGNVDWHQTCTFGVSDDRCLIVPTRSPKNAFGSSSVLA